MTIGKKALSEAGTDGTFLVFWENVLSIHSAPERMISAPGAPCLASETWVYGQVHPVRDSAS